MIINFSRSKTFRLCKRQAFNQYHRGVASGRSMNLVDGGAFHRGVAVGRASKDWQLALSEAMIQFTEDVKASTIPPEQTYLIVQHWEMIEAMINCFKEQYQHEVYQIIQPECEFDVALPESMHSCIFIHWADGQGVDHWGPPPPEMILSHQVFRPVHDIPNYCRCWQPHRLVGKTDAVVAWNSNIWLDEYKTTSIQGQQFWDQWQMDVQPSVYMYGIWRALKIRPRGFLLNSIFKPSEAQVNAWNGKRKYGPPKEMKDYISYSREAFLRTEEDLWRVERLMWEVAHEWEAEVTSGCRPLITPFRYNPGGHTCMSYNRKCDYWSACLNHEQPGEFDGMTQRTPDYVDEKLVQIMEGKQ